MEIEATTEEEAYQKACHFLGLDSNLQKALERTLEAAELFQRVADTATEGAEVGQYISAVAYLKYLANELSPPPPPEPYYDNVIQFSESYRRRKHVSCGFSNAAEESD